MSDSLEQGIGAARLYQGKTGKGLAEGFITLQTAGVRELAEELERVAAAMGKAANFTPIVKKAARIIEQGYAARVNDVTGNLKKSIKTETRFYPGASGQGGATVAVTGPRQTGNAGSSDTAASGNHAWILENGTGRRRPGTQGRRTYLNVHQAINGKMRRHSSANDAQFANMSKGYYFLMGSRNEPTRQARAGSGYPHDFGYTDGKGQHPITLHPGETYGAMPAKHPMERTISASQAAVFTTLRTAIENTIQKLTAS